MDQHHHHHQQLKLTTTPSPHPLAHLPPELPINHNNNSQDRHHELDEMVDDKKNGVLLHLPPTPTPQASSESLNLKSLSPPSGGVRYRECLKNHAASMGSNVVDGCGEFMPSGKEGTLEALKCAACQCHRNFHRRDVRDSSFPCRSVILHLPPPPNLQPFHPHHHHQIVQPMSVAYGGGGGSGATVSSSDDLVQAFDEMPQRELLVETAGSNRKRFRTKFTREQKEKMLEFAEKLGWRLQRQDDEMVDRFCNEAGVKRQVLKVWMHNNKNSFKKQPFIPDSNHEDPPQHHPQIHHLLHPQQQQQQQQQQETL